MSVVLEDFFSILNSIGDASIQINFQVHCNSSLQYGQEKIAYIEN